MTAKGSFFLVMYDITYPKILPVVGKLLLKYGFERINYSVWLGGENPSKNAELKERITGLLQHEKAKGSLFFILPVGKNEITKMRKLNGRKPANLDYWLGREHTLIF